LQDLSWQALACEYTSRLRFFLNIWLAE
jgi:hypothetical protein